MDNDWKFDRFNDGTFKSAEENVIRKYEQFLTEFSNHLNMQVEVMEGYGSTNIDMFFDPIIVECDRYESTNYLGLVSSDNKLLNKIIVTFATVCTEIDFLVNEARTKFIPALAFYGEGVDRTKDEGIHVPQEMGRFLLTLQNIMCFVNRSYDIIKLCIQQLIGLYSKSGDDTFLSDLSNIYFEEVYKSMAKLIFVLITLDEIFLFHGPLQDDWEAYKRILTTAKQDPDAYGLAKEKIQPFENLLMNLEGKLMQGHIFINCCVQNFEDSNDTTCFANIFNKAIKNRLTVLISKIDNSQSEFDERDEFVGWCGLYGLYVTMFGNADKKLFKDVINFFSKLPAVSLPGNRVWYPFNFLRNCLPYLFKFLDQKQTEQIKSRQKSFLQERTGGTFARELSAVYVKIIQWCTKMESDMKRISEMLANPISKGNILIEGIHLANRCRVLCQTVLQLHINLSESITRTTSINICRAVEFCKVIESVVARQNVMILDMINVITTTIAERMNVRIENAKAHVKLLGDRGFSPRQLDILSALSVISMMLSGAATKQRRTVIKIAMPIARIEELLKDDELTELRQNFEKYNLLADYYENIRFASDCTFFFWAKESVFPCYVESILKNSDDPGHLQFVLAALRDSSRGLMVTKHSANSVDLIANYEQKLLKIIDDLFLKPISKSVESDLRVQFYSHIMKTRAELNPFTGSGDIVASSAQSTTTVSAGETQIPKCNLIHFINSKPIRFFDRYISIKDFVEFHLETVFYNLTAIYLSDWRTYAEMRRTAQHQYQLCINIPDMHLPSQSLEQGRDVLTIMRGMAQFSSQYVYNLNTQVFVEKRSDNKFLNTVNIRHVANSIRTHGGGIINTTVNNAYVFLKDKFFQFSEFLYDERIKGKLIKELHEHKERCVQSDQSFPYPNAEKLRTAIRKMFVYPDGTNPLDRFRNHITRMGNAMAFVRSLRSGALNCGSLAANFLPDDEDIDINFEELAKDTGLSNETLHSARNVDVVIKNLSRFFIRDTDYFKMFVEVFAPEFRLKKNIHCSNFYVLFPALSLSFVDHILECKEKLNKKNKDTFIFSDDGFAMGVAFILKVLDLYKEFDSLQWFQCVCEYFDAKQAELKKTLATTGRTDENLRQTLLLKLKRQERRKSEFLLLQYGITSARIFFRADMTAEEERLAKQKKEQLTQPLQHAAL